MEDRSTIAWGALAQYVSLRELELHPTVDAAALPNRTNASDQSDEH
jgi:hypothetical protein